MEMCGAVPTINWDAFNRYLNSPESLEIRRQFAADNPWYARAFPELSAVTTPAPVQQKDHVTKYIMRKIDGAIPVEYVWDKLEVGAFTSFPVMTPVMMTNEIESKFNAMQRHGWSMAKNCKTEWEIRK